MGLLDSAGMQKLWTKIKNKFVQKDSNGKATVAELKVTDSGIDCEGLLEARDGATFGSSVSVQYGETLRLYNEDNTKSADMCCESDGKLSLNGKAVATVDDIPSDSNFVTKDENGDVTVEALQADDGITCVGVLDVREGYSARFFSNDNSKRASLRCDDNGKLTLDGKEVATVDDIPSGGSGDSSIIDLGTQGSHKDAQQEMIDRLLEAEDGCYLFKYRCSCYGNSCLAIVDVYKDVDNDIKFIDGTVYDNYRSFRKFCYSSDEGLYEDGCWLEIASFSEIFDNLPTDNKDVISAICELSEKTHNYYSSGIDYNYTSIGYKVTGIGTCTDTDIVIKSEHYGRAVVSVEVEAFKDCTNITSVVIGDSVISIGGWAFEGCSSLESVTIPDSVTSIGSCAFDYCSSLTSIVIPDSVKSIGTLAFLACPNLTIYCEAPSKLDGWDDNWNASNCPVVWGFANNFIDVNKKLDEIGTGDSSSGGTGGATLSMPRIRFANYQYEEDVAYSYEQALCTRGKVVFSVNVQDGTLQEGDELQVCSMRSVFDKKKLRPILSRTITAEDIENLAKQPYLQISTDDFSGNSLGKNSMRALTSFHRTDSSTPEARKPKYIRIRRPVWKENKNGDVVVVNASFSNVVPIQFNLRCGSED